MGVFYTYWLETSGAVVARTIGHKGSDSVEFVLLFIWVSLPG
jgi:hypothetical protein